MKRFINKVAIVTGAGQGFGLSNAKALAKEGAAVTIMEFNEESAKEMIRALTRLQPENSVSSI